jgi:hypothetical protein
LWNSTFTRVQVYNFDGASVWLEGGGTSSRDPIQFISFEDCILWRKGQANSVALLGSGQVNQVTMRNGVYEGFGASAGQAPGVSVKLCRQLSKYDPSFDASTGKTDPGNGNPYYLSSKAPHTWLFAGVTVQGAQLGVFTDNSQSITFETCHFEGLSCGVHASAASSVRVNDSHFGNTGQASIGGVAPFSTHASGSALMVGRGNWFGGTNGNLASADGAVNNLTQNMVPGGSSPATAGVTWQSPTVSATLPVQNYTTVFVKGGSTELATLTSYLMPGEMITLWAKTSPFTINNTGNIDFTGIGTAGKLVVQVDRSVVLQRVDTANVKPWRVIAGTALFSAT